MPYAQFRDLKLYYEEFGMGEPVQFLHSGFSRWAAGHFSADSADTGEVPLPVSRFTWARAHPV